MKDTCVIKHVHLVSYIFRKLDRDFTKYIFGGRVTPTVAQVICSRAMPDGVQRFGKGSQLQLHVSQVLLPSYYLSGPTKHL